MKRWLLILAAGLCLISAGCGQQKTYRLEVRALALDGADCTVLSYDGHHILMDAGRAADADRIEKRLAELDIDKLDVLVLSQYTEEHAGGAAALLQAIPTGAVWLPGYEPDGALYRALLTACADAGIAPERMESDTARFIGDAGFELWVSPIAYDGTNDSEQSLAVAVTYREQRLIFPGDADGEWLNRLCYGNYNITCDLLKMPQHGDWQKNSFELIAFSFARYALISDSNGEPANSKTVDGLKLIGCKVLQTGGGECALLSDGKSFSILSPEE